MPFFFECSMKSPLCRFVIKSHQQEVLLPHEIFSVLYNEHPDQFSEKLAGTGGVVERFWEEQRGSPLLVDHPLTHEPE